MENFSWQDITRTTPSSRPSPVLQYSYTSHFQEKQGSHLM